MPLLTQARVIKETKEPEGLLDLMDTKVHMYTLNM